MLRKFTILFIIFGFILRIWLMPTTLHPDIRGHNLAGYLIAEKGQLLGFYDYIGHLSRSDTLVKTYGDDLFIYPPLAYWIPGLWLKLPFYSKDLLVSFFYDMQHA